MKKEYIIEVDNNTSPREIFDALRFLDYNEISNPEAREKFKQLLIENKDEILNIANRVEPTPENYKQVSLDVIRSSVGRDQLPEENANYETFISLGRKIAELQRQSSHEIEFGFLEEMRKVNKALAEGSARLRMTSYEDAIDWFRSKFNKLLRDYNIEDIDKEKLENNKFANIEGTLSNLIKNHLSEWNPELNRIIEDRGNTIDPHEVIEFLTEIYFTLVEEYKLNHKYLDQLINTEAFKRSGFRSYQQFLDSFRDQIAIKGREPYIKAKNISGALHNYWLGGEQLSMGKFNHNKNAEGIPANNEKNMKKDEVSFASYISDKIIEALNNIGIKPDQYNVIYRKRIGIHHEIDYLHEVDNNTGLSSIKKITEPKKHFAFDISFNDSIDQFTQGKYSNWYKIRDAIIEYFIKNGMLIEEEKGGAIVDKPNRTISFIISKFDPSSEAAKLYLISFPSEKKNNGK